MYGKFKILSQKLFVLCRVSNPPSAEEQVDSSLSVVFFSGPHPTTVVECLPSDKVRGDAPKYPATTAEEHVRRKLELAAGVIG